MATRKEPDRHRPSIAKTPRVKREDRVLSFSRISFRCLCGLMVVTQCGQAQWLNYPTPDIPRTPDGKPNLSAPTPRKPDGRPALSGVWQLDKDPKYLNDITADFKPGEFRMQAWAETLTKERMTGAHASEFPPAHCLPQGIPILDGSSAVGYPVKIVQEPTLVVILYEAF